MMDITFYFFFIFVVLLTIALFFFYHWPLPQIDTRLMASTLHFDAVRAVRQQTCTGGATADGMGGW